MSGLRLAAFGLFARVTNSDGASTRFHDIVSAAGCIPLDHALSDDTFVPSAAALMNKNTIAIGNRETKCCGRCRTDIGATGSEQSWRKNFITAVRCPAPFPKKPVFIVVGAGFGTCNSKYGLKSRYLAPSAILQTKAFVVIPVAPR
jgi:hypothetical protein